MFKWFHIAVYNMQLSSIWFFNIKYICTKMVFNISLYTFKHLSTEEYVR